jgi:hypothetical protein
MVRLILGDREIDLEDEYADVSTYIRGARSFSISTTGRNEVDVKDIDDDLLFNYISYLEGSFFTMTDRDRDLFTWMGHVNTNNSPEWKDILRARRYLHLYKDYFLGITNRITKKSYSMECSGADISNILVVLYDTTSKVYTLDATYIKEVHISIKLGTIYSGYEMVCSASPLTMSVHDTLIRGVRVPAKAMMSIQGDVVMLTV